MSPFRFLLLAPLPLLASCIDFDGATQPIDVAVRLALPDELSGGVHLAGHTVTLTQGGQKFTAITDAEGRAHFNNLTPDQYDIAAAWTISAADYAAASGRTVQGNDYAISASALARLLDGSQEEVVLTLTATERQSLVISKVYAAGSKDANGRNYDAGKYVELYNNSDQAVDLAGYCLGLLDTGSTPAYLLGQTPEYLYLKQVFRFPKDRQHLVPAGGTVLVANSAIDHRANDAPAEHDLSQADFEAKDAQGKTVNNPATPPMELVFTTWPLVTQMNLVQGGPTGIVLFHDDRVETWPQVYAYGKSKGTQFLRMPTRSVRDGVDIIKMSATSSIDLSAKRLYDWIDAGYTTITSPSGRNGEVSYRRLAPDRPEGRPLLLDTNNSTQDFAVSATIAPRQLLP